MKALSLIAVAVLVIGGYLLLSSRGLLRTTPVTPSPTPVASLEPQEQKWQDSQATDTGSDVSSLEKDINVTVIQNEDFSDLK